MCQLKTGQQKVRYWIFFTEVKEVPENEKLLYHFERTLIETSKAFERGLFTKGAQWALNLTKKSKNWDSILQNLLRDQD